MGGTALVVVLALVAARMALPWYLRSYVNRTLDQSPDYDGRIGEIDVHLWRGAYTIHDLNIVKTSNAVPVPFFESPRVDFSLNWGALLHGGARGKIVMDRPRLNFVQGPSEEETQTGADQPWLQIINELYPFRIDRAEVHQGEIHFHAFHTRPPVDVFLSEVEGTLTNLTNIENRLDPLVATLSARGTAMGSGQLSLDMTFDPTSYRPSFNLAAKLLDLQVTKLNSLTRAYGDFDFEVGRFDFVLEAAATDGSMDGYAKPLFRGVKVLGVRDLGEARDPFQLFWEALVGIVGEVFKNQERDQFGTRITLQGDLDSPRTDLMEIIGNVLYNAFVRAYLPRLEGRVAPGVVTSGETGRHQSQEVKR
jgi:uncharacterized protein DUF748